MWHCNELAQRPRFPYIWVEGPNGVTEQCGLHCFGTMSKAKEINRRKDHNKSDAKPKYLEGMVSC
jgi:hypothetical protein